MPWTALLFDYCFLLAAASCQNDYSALLNIQEVDKTEAAASQAVMCDP